MPREFCRRITSPKLGNERQSQCREMCGCGSPNAMAAPIVGLTVDMCADSWIALHCTAVADRRAELCGVWSVECCVWCVVCGRAGVPTVPNRHRQIDSTLGAVVPSVAIFGCCVSLLALRLCLAFTLLSVRSPDVSHRLLVSVAAIGCPPLWSLALCPSLLVISLR